MRDAVQAPSESEVSTLPDNGNGNGNSKMPPAELSTVGYYQEMPANEKKTLGARIEEKGVRGDQK